MNCVVQRASIKNDMSHIFTFLFIKDNTRTLLKENFLKPNLYNLMRYAWPQYSFR